MKSKKLRIVALILVAVIIGGAVWWFARTPGNMATASAPVASAAKANAPKTVVQITQVTRVELPKAPAVAASEGKIDSPAEDAAQAQAELKADFLNIGRLLRAGDYATYRETYMLPEMLVPGEIEKLRDSQVRGAAARASDPDNPNARFKVQLDIEIGKSYEALANQTPTFNSAGDEATYQYIGIDQESGSDTYGTYTGDGEPTPMTFMKIDGRWYLKPSNYKKPDSQGK